MNKHLLVSLHDVTPKYSGELSEIVAELDRIGVTKRSILVVPNWESEYDLRREDHFVSWLHELKLHGDEMLLHGYCHRTDKRAGYYEDNFQWFMGEFFAQGTGEFQISYFYYIYELL